MILLSQHLILTERLNRAEAAFRNATPLHGERHRQRWIFEAALSDAWQGYCSFVRHVCIASSTGCQTASGAVLAASVAPPTWQRASYVSIRSSKNAAVHPAQTNSSLRREPTWGDSSKITDIVGGLNPANKATLVAHFAGGLTGPKHCQVVRNAAAHKNHQTKDEVEALAASYVASRILYPTDAMLWRDPANGDYAFLSWLEDMKVIAAGAIQ